MFILPKLVDNWTPLLFNISKTIEILSISGNVPSPRDLLIICVKGNTM